MGQSPRREELPVAALHGLWGLGGLQGSQSSLEMLASRIDDAFICGIIDVLLYSDPGESKVPGFLLLFLFKWDKLRPERCSDLPEVTEQFDG